MGQQEENAHSSQKTSRFLEIRKIKAGKIIKARNFIHEVQRMAKNFTY